MAKIRINWALIFVILIALVVLALTAFGLRSWNRSNRAETGLKKGLQAYDNKQWEEAAVNLGKYLSFNQDDTDVLMKYGLAQLNRVPPKKENLGQADNVLRRVLRIEDVRGVVKHRTEATTKLIYLYLQMNQPAEAEHIAVQHLKIQKDPQIRRLLALALINQRKYQPAADELKAIIEEDSSQMAAYNLLSRIAEQQPGILSEKADYWLNQAVSRNPSSADAYISRAAFHLSRNNLGACLADLKKAQICDLTDTAVRLRLATGLVDADALDNARSHLEAVYKIEPDNIEMWQIWAVLALKTDSSEEIRKIAENALQSLGQNSLLFLPVACEMYIRCGDIDKAVDCIDKMRKQDFSLSTAEFLEGLIAEKQQKWNQAAKAWQKAVELGYRTENAYFKIVSAFVQMGNRQSAIRQLRAYVAENQNSYSARVQLAELLAETGNWTESAEQAKLALQLKPGAVQAKILQIRAQIQMQLKIGAPSDNPAWHTIENELAALPKEAKDAMSVRMLMLQTAVYRQQYDTAARLVGQLKKDYPDTVQPALAEVDLLIARNSIAEAITMLEQIIKQFPKSSGAVTYLAGLLARQNEFDKCRTLLSESITSASSATDRRQYSLLLADLYARNNQNDKAYSLLSSTVKEVPDDIPLLRRLITFAYATKNKDVIPKIIDDIKNLEGPTGWQWRFEQARFLFSSDDFKANYNQVNSLLRENLNANPDDQSSRLLLAAAYDQAGQNQLALTTYREAISRSPDDINIILPAVAAMYMAQQYEQADEILKKLPQAGLTDPRLTELRLQSSLRQGQLDIAEDILEKQAAADKNNEKVRLAMARLKIIQGRIDEAEKIIDDIKNTNPDSIPVIAVLVDIARNRGNNDKAIELCNQAVQKFADSASYILRGRTYSGLGNIKQAAEDIDKAVQLEPDNVRILLLKADFCRSAGMMEQSIKATQKAVSLAPDDFQVYKQAAIILTEAQDSATAKQGAELLEKALQASPEDVDLRIRKAQLLLFGGTRPAIDTAVDILEKLAIDQPKNATVWAMLAEVYNQKGDSGRVMDVILRGLSYMPASKPLMLIKARAEAAQSPDLALPTLTAMRTQYPEDSDIAVLLANTYIAAEQPKKAISIITEQLKSAAKENSMKLDITLASALLAAGQTEQAKEKFDALYKAAPNDPALVIAHAGVLKNLAQWSEITGLFAEWTRKNPADSRPVVIIAEQLISAGEVDARQTAEKIVRTAMTASPDSADLMNSLAIILQMNGKSEEAAALYEKVLASQPNRLVTLNNLAWLLCQNKKDYNRAMTLAEKGLSIQPDYIDLIDTRGMIYYNLARYDKALIDFKMCVEKYTQKNPALVSSYLNLGRTLTKLSRWAEAADALTKARTLNEKTKTLSATELVELEQLLSNLKK